MVIAVNTQITGKDAWQENDNFIFETFSRIIKLHPQHTFVLIAEGKLTGILTSFENVINVSIGSPKKNPVLRYAWNKIKIPAVLKKYKADVFISYGGTGSLATKIDQYVIIPDLDFIHQPFFSKKSHLLFYKTLMRRSILNAKTIVTFSEFCKAGILKQYKLTAGNIQVVYTGVDQRFKAIGHEQKEIIKAKHAHGNEYFIYTGQIGTDKNLLNLLKAFSAFKKRQKSNMQLLIAGKPGWKYESFIENLRLFKFKDEVQILKDVSSEEMVNITAAAYAMVYPSLDNGFPTQPLQAMQCRVPVISSSKEAVTEICGDAALYTDVENFKEITVQMMHLFKDENFRKESIEKGSVQAQKFNWDNTADLFWNGLATYL